MTQFDHYCRVGYCKGPKQLDLIMTRGPGSWPLFCYTLTWYLGLVLSLAASRGAALTFLIITISWYELLLWSGCSCSGFTACQVQQVYIRSLSTRSACAVFHSCVECQVCHQQSTPLHFLELNCLQAEAMSTSDSSLQVGKWSGFIMCNKCTGCLCQRFDHQVHTALWNTSNKCWAPSSVASSVASLTSGSLVGWISDTLFQAYTNLQSLATQLVTSLGDARECN